MWVVAKWGVKRLYKWDESFKNTDPICRKWVYPEIKNKPFRTAMQEWI